MHAYLEWLHVGADGAVRRAGDRVDSSCAHAIESRSAIPGQWCIQGSSSNSVMTRVQWEDDSSVQTTVQCEDVSTVGSPQYSGKTLDSVKITVQCEDDSTV